MKNEWAARLKRGETHRQRVMVSRAVYLDKRGDARVTTHLRHSYDKSR